MNILAATITDHRSCTMSRASVNRTRGVRAALAWDTKAAWFVKRFLDSSTSQPVAFAYQQLNRDSRNIVPGHHI
jgi:hypothetical protein